MTLSAAKLGHMLSLSIFFYYVLFWNLCPFMLENRFTLEWLHFMVTLG